MFIANGMYRISGFLLGFGFMTVLAFTMGQIKSSGIPFVETAAISLLLLIPVFYFLPAVIACKRNARYGGSIFLVNFVFGWTVLGWIAALIWAIVESSEEQLANDPSPERRRS